MKKWILWLVLTAGLLNAGIGAQTASQIPGGTDNYLMVGATVPGLGDLDEYAVVFFEIPLSVTSPLYFGVYDPDFYYTVPGGGVPPTEDSSSEYPGVNTPVVDPAFYCYLVGGDGTLTHPDSRLVDYMIDGDDPLAPGLGTVLTQFINSNVSSNDGWVYFAGVDPEQGELVGTKRYFKIVLKAETSSGWVKNGFKLDISLTGSGNPTGVSGVRSFAYSWPVFLKETNSWDLYPFVPDSAAGEDIIFYNWDMDNGESLLAYDKDETPLAAPSISADCNNRYGDAGTGNYTNIGVGETNGTWHLNILEDATGGTVDLVNLAEFWFTDQNWNGTTVKNGVYRTYAANYDDPPAAADISVSSSDGLAIADGSDTETIVLQVVDAAGDPAPYSRNIWVEVNGSASITAANAFYPGYSAGGGNALLVTDGDGIGWVTISDNVVETVTLTAAVNGATAPGTNANEANLTPTIHTVDVEFQSNPPPLLSSAGNLTFYDNDVAPALNLQDITITEVGPSSISSGAGNIIIRIPAGLNAQFDTGGGDPVFSGDVGAAGFTRNSDSLVVNPAASFSAGQQMIISGLRFDPATDAPSSGRLELAVDGGGFTIIDDKRITILDPNPTFIWDGSADSNWGTDANWSGGTAPAAATDNILIPLSGVTNMPVLNAAPQVNTLTIAGGASLDLNGFDLQVNSSFSNAGRLILQGGETLNLVTGMDTDSGEVEYTGTGVYVGLAAGDSYYDLIFNGSGSWELDAPLGVNGDIHLDSGTLDVSVAEHDISIGGSWAASGGTFTPRNGTVTFTGSGTLAPGGPFHALVVNTSGSVTLAGNLNVDGALTINSGTLAGNAYTINLAGDWDSGSGTFTYGTSTVNFDGAGSLLSDAALYNAGIANGFSLDANGRALTVNGGSFNNLGTLYRTGGGGESAPADTNSGTVIYRGAGGTIQDYNAPPTADYYELEIAGPGTFSPSASNTLTTAAGLSLSGGNLDLGAEDLAVGGGITSAATLDASGGGDVSVAGDVAFTGTGGYTSGAGLFSFTGGGAQSMRSNSSGMGDVAVSTDNTVVTMLDSLSCADLTLSGAGVSLIAGTYNLVVSGQLSCAATLDASGGGDVTVTGPADFSGGTYTKGTGVFTFNGNSSRALQADSQDLGTVSIQATPGNVVVLTDELLADNFTIGASAALHLDPALSSPVILRLNNGRTLANNGTLLVLDNDDTVTLTSPTGNTFAFSGNDIDYNGNVIRIGRVGNYQPDANLGANEGIAIFADSVFAGTLDLTAAGATLDIDAGITLSTLNGNVTVSTGTLTLGTGATLDTGTGGVSSTGTIASAGEVLCGAFSSTGTYTNTAANSVTASGNVVLSGISNGTAADYSLLMTGAGTTLQAAYQLGALQADVSGAGGTVSLTGSALSLAGNLQVAGDTTLDAATYSMTVNGNADISGVLDFSADGITLIVGGTLTCSGTINNTGNGNINLGGNADFSTGTFAKGSGTLTFTGNSTKNFLPAAQDFGDVVLADVATNIVDVQGSLTVDNLEVAGVNARLQLNPSASVPVTVTINTGGVLTNNGVLRVMDTEDVVTLTSTGGNTFQFSGNDIDYNGNGIHLAGVNPYQPAVLLGNNEGITVDEDAVFDQSVTLDGTDAFFTIATGKNVALSDVAFTNTVGTLTIASGAGLDCGAGALDNAGTLNSAGALACAAFTSTGTFESTGTNTITAAGDVTISGNFQGAAVTDNTLSMTGGGTSLSASPQLGNLVVDSPGNTVTLSGSNLSLAGTLEVTATTIFAMATFSITAGGNAVFYGDLDASGGNGVLLFQGDAAFDGGDFSAGGGSVTINGNFSIASGSGFTAGAGDINANGDVDFSGGVFSAGSGTFNLDGTAAQDVTSDGNSFGTVRLLSGSNTISILDDWTCADLAITAGTTLEIAAHTLVATTFDIADNATLSRSGGVAPKDTDSGTVVYHGTVGTTDIQAYPGDDYHELVIESDSFNLAAGNDYVVTGNFVLEAGGTFSLNGQTLSIAGNFDNSAGGIFNHDGGTVALIDNSIDSHILGNNIFYNLFCVVPGKTIYFGEGNIVEIYAPGGTIRMHGSAVSPISLGLEPPLSINWNIVVPAGATVDMHDVNIDHSAANPSIAVPPDNVNPDESTCTGWVLVIDIENSWVYDLNKNGKLDTLEIQVAGGVLLNDNFTDIRIEVTGYTITGIPYSRHIDLVDASYDNYFYIDLVEGETLDTGHRPEWSIISNSLLRDETTQTRLVGVTSAQTPVDNAPPVIGYTLALADHPQIFIHFSEGLSHPGGGPVVLSDFTSPGYAGSGTVTAFTPLNSADQEPWEVLLDLSADVTAAEVLGQTLLQLTALEDMSADSLPLISTTHRVSDLGLGLVGNGVVEPVWAADETMRDPVLGGIGYISDFDGTGWLRDQELTLQAHIHDGITAPGLAVNLIYDVGVPANYTRSGRWLPLFQTDFYNGLVPYPNSSSRSVTGNEVAGQLRNFTISAEDSEIKEGAQVEFFFQFPATQLFCARNSDSNPAGGAWYKEWKPWSFTIRDVRQQKANVSVLKNVFNPAAGESAGLHYILPRSGLVTIQVFDLKGDIIDVLFRGRRDAGDYSLSWDGRNRGDRVVARGIYFIKVIAPGINETRKVLVVK